MGHFGFGSDEAGWRATAQMASLNAESDRSNHLQARFSPTGPVEPNFHLNSGVPGCRQLQHGPVRQPMATSLVALPGLSLDAFYDRLKLKMWDCWPIWLAFGVRSPH